MEYSQVDIDKTSKGQAIWNVLKYIPQVFMLVRKKVCAARPPNHFRWLTVQGSTMQNPVYIFIVNIKKLIEISTLADRISGCTSLFLIEGNHWLPVAPFTNMV